MEEVMTNLTARELIDTMLRSLAETRAKFRKAAPATSDEHTTLQPAQNETPAAKEAAPSESD